MKTALIILIVLLAIVVLFVLICGFIFNQAVWRKQLPIPAFLVNMLAGNEDNGNKKYDSDHDKALKTFTDLPFEKVEMTAENGEKMHCKVLVPPISNGKLIIACHGARSSGVGEFCFMKDYFCRNGFTIIMPDHRGCGESDGKFLGYGTHESADTLKWLDYAKKRFPKLDIFLLGVSMGAATVLMMSDKVSQKDVRGIISDCAYTSVKDEFSYQVKTSFHFPSRPLLDICNVYCKALCKYGFKDAEPIEHVKNAKVPILFIHGKSDDFVPFYMEKQLYDACTSDKTLVEVDGAIHARSYYTNPMQYETAMNEFIKKYS